MNEELKKVATRGRGKGDKAHKALWIDAFTTAIRTNPCGTVILEGTDGKPKPEEREFSKRTAWAFELMKTDEWGYSTVLNLDKVDGAVRFTHTLRWCMEKLKKDRDLFTKGTFDRCRARLHNLVSGDFIMIAVLVPL
jgi:hypothetical protein